MNITERKGRRGTTYRVQIRRNGHAIHKSFSTRARAEAYGRRIEGDIENNVASPLLAAKSKTLNDLIDEYLPKTESMKDWRAIKARVGFWRRELGKLTLAQITSERITETLDAYAEDHETSSCNRLLSCLRQILKIAIKRKLVAVNPAAKDYVSNRPEPEGRKRTITADEWKRLSAAASRSPCDELLPLLVTLKESAMRLSEVTELTVDRVDFATGTAQLYATQTKTGRPRAVALTPPAVAALRSLVPDADGRFFRLTQGQLRYAFRQALKAANIGVDAFGEPIVFHSFRHSLASALANNGASLFELKSVTGHARTSSLERYVKVQQTTAHSVLARLAAKS